jgi:hypothetical protein
MATDPDETVMTADPQRDHRHAENQRKHRRGVEQDAEQSSPHRTKSIPRAALFDFPNTPRSLVPTKGPTRAPPPNPKKKKIIPNIHPKTHLFRFCCARKVPAAHRRPVR